MKKDDLIKRLKNTTSLVEFYKLKTNIIEHLEPAKTTKKTSEDEE